MTRPTLHGLILVIVGPLQLLAQSPPAPPGLSLPDGAIHRFGNRQLRHPERILSAAVSPDDKYLATAGESTVIVWDLKTLTPKHILLDVPINDASETDGGRLAFLPDSKSLLVPVRPEPPRRRAANTPKMECARVFDVESGKLRFAIEGPSDDETGVWPASGGKEIAVFRDNSLTFWDARDGKKLRSASVEKWVPEYALVSLAADRLVFAHRSRSSVHVVDLATQKEIYTPNLTVKPIQVALGPGGKILACCYGDGKVRAYDVDAKKELHSFQTSVDRPPFPLAVSPDNKALYVGGRDGKIAHWDLTTGRQRPDIGTGQTAGRQRLDVGRPATVDFNTLALSPNGSILYSAGQDRMIRRWDLNAGKELPFPDGYVGDAATALTPDGKHVVIADHAGRIDFWDLATGKVAKQLQSAGKEAITSLAVSNDGRWLACGRKAPEVQLWDLSTGKVERVIRLVEQADRDEFVQRVLFSSDGRVVFASINGVGPTACEVATGKKIWNYSGGGYNFACDPRGRFIASGQNGQPVVISMLDATTGAALRHIALETHPGAIERDMDITTVDRTFTPDGSRLLSFHEDGTVRAWDPVTGREVARLKSDTDGNWRPGGLACSADGKWVAIRENRNTRRMQVWELASARQLFAITGHDSLVRDLTFTRDGRGLIGNADLAPILWSLEPKDLPKVDGPTDEMWETLASDDAAKAYRLQWALVRNPKTAVALFGEKIKPNELVVDPAQFKKWLGNLDGAQFRTREIAERELMQAGHRVPVGWLSKALREAKSEELRSRLERMIAQRQTPGPAEWRLSRAVQTLELAGKHETKALMESWVTNEETTLGMDAKAALTRLRTR